MPQATTPTANRNALSVNTYSLFDFSFVYCDLLTALHHHFKLWLIASREWFQFVQVLEMGQSQSRSQPPPPLPVPLFGRLPRRPPVPVPVRAPPPPESDRIQLIRRFVSEAVKFGWFDRGGQPMVIPVQLIEIMAQYCCVVPRKSLPQATAPIH